MNDSPHLDAYRALDTLDEALARMTYDTPDGRRTLDVIGRYHTRALRSLVECHERGTLEVRPGPDAPTALIRGADPEEDRPVGFARGPDGNAT